MLSAACVLQQTPPVYHHAGPTAVLEQLRDVIRRKNYSLRTEDAYVDWSRRFVAFCGMRHPRDCGAPELEAFLTDLAVKGPCGGLYAKPGAQRDSLSLQRSARRGVAVARERRDREAPGEASGGSYKGRSPERSCAD